MEYGHQEVYGSAPYLHRQHFQTVPRDALYSAVASLPSFPVRAYRSRLGGAALSYPLSCISIHGWARQNAEGRGGEGEDDA